MSLTTTAYQIGMENGDIVVRLNKSLIDYDGLIKLLDYVTLEMIRKQSQLTPVQAEALADEVQSAAWEKVKHLFERALTRE